MEGTPQSAVTAVLVVDDHPVNRFHVSELLGGLGARPLCAASAAEALTLLSHELPGLILLDLEMPGRDGIEALQSMRERHGDALPPVVGLTAAGDDRRARFLDQGLLDCLEKPLLRSELQCLLQAGPTGPNGAKEVRQEPGCADALPEFDWDECIELAGGRIRHAEEMLTIMLETLGPCVEQIQSAAVHRELGQVRNQVHYLAGACRYCSAPRLRHLCNRLERELERSAGGSLRRLPQLYSAASTFAHTAGEALSLLSRISQFEQHSSTTNASA